MTCSCVHVIQRTLHTRASHLRFDYASSSSLPSTPSSVVAVHFEAVLVEEGLEVVGVHVRLGLGLDAKPELEGLVVDDVVEREAVLLEDVLERVGRAADGQVELARGGSGVDTCLALSLDMMSASGGPVGPHSSGRRTKALL